MDYSYALNCFLSRSCKNGRLVRTNGSPIGHSIIDLSKFESSDILLVEKSSARNENIEKKFNQIANIIKIAFYGNNNPSAAIINDYSSHKPLSQQNDVISKIFTNFIQSTSGRVRLVWVENHSSLVEAVKDNIPTFIRSLIPKEKSTDQNDPLTTTFLVDVSFFLNADKDEELFKIIQQNEFLISLCYRLGFVRGISRLMNFTDKESIHITLSLLDNGEENLDKTTTSTSTSNKSLRTILINFLDSNATRLHLDHDQSLLHCLKQIEQSCQELPDRFYFKNIFQLERLLYNEKDKNLRNLIKTNILKRNKQVVLLMKQMDISLPYPRQEFQKSYQHYDIKVRRELCFQLIKNFDRSTEASNISAIVSRLKNSSKYSINEPKLVVGRESRAFGNQAYLFANSKLIYVNDEMVRTTNQLRNVCGSIEKLKSIILEHVVDAVNTDRKDNSHPITAITLNDSNELSEILAQLELKFESFLYELVPSIGRLISLVFNTSKSSSFTQYNGAFQNFRESLEIFLRKSLAEVEKQRKKFIEDFYESSTAASAGAAAATAMPNEIISQSDHQSRFFSNIFNALIHFSGKSGQIEKLIQRAEEIIYSLYASSTGSTRGAYSVLLQRPSFTGSERFKLNELETKPEQEESLQKLVTNGGDHLYMSPSYEWISQATDLIEAVPLFIYERTIVVNDKQTTVFEVDQEGLEQTIRQIAEYWAQNIDLTIESEHITLARSIIVRLDPTLRELSNRIEHHEQNSNFYHFNRDICDLIAIELLIDNKSMTRNDLSIKIAKLSELIGSYYNNDELCVKVEHEIEKSWHRNDFITRIEGLERVLTEEGVIGSKLLDDAEKLSETSETRRLASKAFEKQRPLPAFHLLTTEAPGLVEGFITVVLEEEMAMRNVIRSFGLDDQVKHLMIDIQAKLALIAQTVIHEFGYEPIVSQHMSNGLNKQQAILRVMSENLPIEEEVSKIAILLQMFYYETSNSNNESINISLPYSQVDVQTLVNSENYWSTQIQLDIESIKQESFKLVYEKNKTDYDFNEALNKYVSQQVSSSSLGLNVTNSSEILNQHNEKLLADFLTNDPIYSEEFKATIKWIIRSNSFHYICDKYPDLHLQQRLRSFIREHTSLVQTTCRRHVISKNGLHSKLSHPRYAYSSGVTFDDSNIDTSGSINQPSASFTSSKPTGLRKRYHLIYAPSRVNLGKDERKSVENWSQFLGVSDPLAARHAQTFYEMINYSPVIRNIREAENLKVSENQWTALIRSVRNVQAFFVERLGVGDIEDLSYQFNQRGGINFGSLKEGESYNSGPTAGYCIPKDLLFKLFVGTHQDSRKLLQIGVPKFLHRHLIALMVDVYSYKEKFSTIGEWELWAAEEFLSKEKLSKRFEQNLQINNENSSTNPADHISSYLKNYIKLSGSQIVFHLTKLIQILGNTGVPSPLLSISRDLHSVLWSNWSDHKITLGGEQVNRATVFTLTREIPEAAKRSRLLNPKAGIALEDSLRVQMYGVYKGDDDEPPPPDVRYSWTMRAFQIMSGHYQAVADSLDHEGQIIARLSWVGFRPDSNEPKDIEAKEYLLRKFNEENNNEILGLCSSLDTDSAAIDSETNSNSNKLIERLRRAFPCHTTVGDITITAVHGVDSEDLLGFSAETLTLLGEEADRVKQILETHGHMSIDQMKANALLRRKFPEEWTPLNQLTLNEQENIKELVGPSYHPLVLRLRGPGTNFISDLQGQDVVVFSITHPEVLKLDPAHLRDLMIVGRPASALCVLDFVAQGRHRCWYERDVMLWYASSRGLTIKGKLSLDWTQRNHNGRQSVYKAFGTGIDQYSPSLGTDLRSEVIRQEKRAIDIWNAAKNLNDIFTLLNSNQSPVVNKSQIADSIEKYQTTLSNHLSSDILLTEALYYQQYSQKLLMSKRFKIRDKIIQESVQKLGTIPKYQLSREFNPIDWLCIGGIFLINGTPKTYQNEILKIIKKANQIVKSFNSGSEFENNVDDDLIESDLISKLIVPQLEPTRMTLGEKKGEMFSVKASEDSQSRAVTRRAQLSIQADLQLSIKHRTKGFEMITNNTKRDESSVAFTLKSIFNNARNIMFDLSSTPAEIGYSLEYVNEKYGLITRLTMNALEIIINKLIKSSLSSLEGVTSLSKEDLSLKEFMIDSINQLYQNGSVNLKVLDVFCGTYENHGIISKLLELAKQNENESSSLNINELSESIDDILSVCELLYYLLALEKTNQFLTKRYHTDYNTDLWRKLSEFFAKTIDDHFYEYNPWILDPKRGSAFVNFYDDLGVIKKEYNSVLYSTSWSHHRLLYKYLNNLILNHSDMIIKVPNENDRNLLIGKVVLGEKQDGSEDRVVTQSIGNNGVGEEIQNDTNKNYESLWRAYNQLREIAFMRNDGFEFPVVFSQLDSKHVHGLNSSKKINLAILSPIGRTHYSRAISESGFLNDNIYITRTGFLSDDGKTRLKYKDNANIVSREKKFLFIEDAHFYLTVKQYHSSLKNHYGMSDEEAWNQIELDKKLGRITGKGVRVAATFKEPVLIGCCIAHHHHPLEKALTEAGYPATDKSPFLFDLTYNKSLYPVMYSLKASHLNGASTSNTKENIVLLPPQIDWFQSETILLLEEQIKKYAKTHQQAEDFIIESIKERLRPFAIEHGIIIAKGAAESGARNLSRFDIRNLGLNVSDKEKSHKSNDLLDENILVEASKFIYQVSKGQNVTIQRAIVSTPLSWMSHYAVGKFLERQIVEHSVSVNIEKYPKDFIYGTLRVIFSSSVPDLNDLSNPSNWHASHLISLSSLQMATNVGRQGTLEILAPEMIHTKFRDTFIRKLSEAGKKAMSLTSIFGPRYWNEEINLDATGKSYNNKQISNSESINNLNHCKILPYKVRKPNYPELDACGVPYWWPRYLMLDLIAEPLFVDKEGREISGAHIIDITITQTKDGGDEFIHLVRDKNGKVCEGRIIDFVFWLLEPNVGIGLWPNYWKRELVRCQENGPKQVDYQQVGISDRIVLSNFLKAGNEFLKVKVKTNEILNQKFEPEKENSVIQSNILSTLSNTAQDSPVSSVLSLTLCDSLSNSSLKYGIASIGNSQVSLWISEFLRTLVLKKYPNVSDDDAIAEILDYSLDLINKITLQDLTYCINKSNDNSSLNKGTFIPTVNVNGQDVINWLANRTYTKRVCEITIDSLLSELLSPLLEISPIGISQSELIKYSKTLVVITEKTAHLTHHLYPFIAGRGDYPINIVGVHSSWILKGSNLARRAILYDSLSHRFIEADLNTPLILDYGFIVELFTDNEVLNYSKMSDDYESAGLKIINSAVLSRERADDKLWIRKNKPNGITTPRFIELTEFTDLENNNELIKSIESFVLACSDRGIVLQPSANTTESLLVEWLTSSTHINEILNASKRIYDSLNNLNDTQKTPISILLSEYRGNVCYKEAPVVFRFNVSAQSHVTVAAYVGGSPQTKIVQLKGTCKKTNANGYCERLDVVLNDLYDTSTKRKVLITCSTWNNLLNQARLVSKCIGLPLIGIDILFETNEDTINPIVLEVNTRPGTLIFGEELIFDESGSFWTHSIMSPPVNEDFWNLLPQLSNKSSYSIESSYPRTLLQWKLLMSSENITKWHRSNISSNNNQISNRIISWFVKRYGLNEPDLIHDRISCLVKTIDDCIMSNQYNDDDDDKFDLNKEISIVFSNGRDRYFGGHTDLLGLGGPTINATTENEIISIIQQSNDSSIHVSNSNKEFESSVFDIAHLLDCLNEFNRTTPKIEQLGKELWSPAEWTSYLKGSLAFMLSSDFSGHTKVKNSLFKNNIWTGCRVHFNSSGKLKLQPKVGSSSSSALTSSFVLGLNKIFNIGLDIEELSKTDYGEFYLGKTGGCADITTILNAKKGKLIIISSIPDRFIQSFNLPNQIVVIMANSNIPRLNSVNGRNYLLNLKDNSSSQANIYTSEQVDTIVNYFNGIMRRFGSFVFIRSVELIVENLINVEKYEKCGISREESVAVLKSFGYDEYGKLANNNDNNNIDQKNTFNFGNSSLLRELACGGELEKNLPIYSGWTNRHKRYNLIFKILKLLPESMNVSIGGYNEIIHPRKSTLYGISEIERCHSYLALMNQLNNSNENVNENLMKLLDLVRWAHDGDRATQDYRRNFCPTSWSTNQRNLVNDQTLDKWISNNNKEELIDKPGGFERSLPEFDEWATSLDETFQNQAALRVSAAGIGGTICIHSLSSIASDVTAWLKNKGFSVRSVKPGPSYEIL